MTQTAALTFSEADLRISIPARFRRVLDQLPPDQLAYVSADEKCAYQELAAMSRGLAEELVARLGAAGSRSAQKAVALLLPPHSAAALTGIMGVLEAGHFYVPLDFVMGEAALRQVLLDCLPEAVVTTAALQERLKTILPAGQDPPVVCLDTLAPRRASLSGIPDADAQMCASVLYTSGSTGRPRGVMCTHALNVYASYLAHLDLGFTSGGRTSHLRSYAHASSTQPIFGGLLNGATLHAPPRLELTPTALYQWIAEREITHLHVSLGLLRGLAELADTHRPLTSLRVIITGGEALHRSDVERLYQVAPASCKIVARLVSTEATVYARFVVEPGTSWQGSQIPAGYAPPGCQVMIVDENHQPVACGQPGEIAVRSRFLAAGYWQRPAETAARFLPDPEDGQQRVFLTGDLGRLSADGLLEHLGRQDFMVKVRGYRVQTEAVEAALMDLDDVAEAAVVARDTRSGEKQLIAYIVPSTRPYPTVSALRDALLARLPDYMAPSRFVLLEKLPRNAAGKVDRAALPPCGRARPELRAAFVAPRNVLEEQIADIWAEVLELDEVGADDNFYELGGDSILALRLGLDLERRLGRRVPASYFHKPTVALLARALEDEAVAVEAPSLRQPAVAGRPNPWMGRIRRVLRGQINTSALLERAVQEIAMRLTYRQGWRLLAWWCGQPIVQYALYGRERALLQRLAGALDSPAPSRAGLRFFLVNNMVYAALQRWRAGKLFQSDDLMSVMAGNRRRFWRSLAEQAAQGDVPGRPPLIVFDGYERFARAHAQGRGVILLTYHCASGPLASDLLARRAQCGPIVNLGQAQAGVRAVLMGDAVVASTTAAEAVRIPSGFGGGDPRGPAHVARRTAWSAVLSYEGMNILRDGGVVLIANDTGYNSAGAVPRGIGGRLYQLKPGFAELALATGAAVVPMYSSYEASGAIRMTFLPPLEAAPGLADHAAQADDLVNQYVGFLEAAWRAAPESMRRGDLVDHFARPPAPGLEATSV